MSSGIVRYVMQVVGGAQVRQALRGVVAETRGADRQIAQSGQVTARLRSASTRTQVTEARQGAQARVRVETEADRAIVRSARETSREQRRLRLAEERDMRRALRDQARAGSGGRGGGARGTLRALGGAALGVGQAIAGRVEGYQGTLGLPSRDQLVGGFIDRQERLVRLGVNSGIGVDQLQQTVSQGARAGLVSQDELVAGLEMAQTALVDQQTPLSMFVDNLDAIARASHYAGGSVSDWMVAIGQMQKQLGVNAEDTNQLIGAMISASSTGAIEAGDFAATFSDQLGTFSTLRGEGGSGIGGAREFAALAQVLGTAGGGPAETATLMSNLFTALSRDRTRGGIEDGLGDASVFNDQGDLTIGFPELFARMAENQNFQGAAALEGLFPDAQARQAVITVMNAFERGNGVNPLAQVRDANAEQGNASTDEFFRQLEDTASGRAQRARAEMEANFAQNGDALVQTMINLAGPMGELTTSYPLATEALSAMSEAASAAAGALGTIGLMNLATGGGGIVSGALGGGGGVLGGVMGGAGGSAVMGGLAFAAPWLLGPAAILGGVGAAYNRHQELSAEENRRAGAERFLAENVSAISAETLANASGDLSLVTDGGVQRRERRRVGAGLAREADENLAAIMGRGGPTGPVTVRLDPETIREMATGTARAIDRGAPAAGREPGETGRRR